MKPDELPALTIRLLQAEELQKAQNLLLAHDMRPEGVLDAGTTYWGAFDGDSLIGLIGLEWGSDSALLRSAVVEAPYRSRGLGQRLFHTLRAAAQTRGIKTMYLFTVGAGLYWMKLGFTPVSPEEVAAVLPHAPQVRLFVQLGWLPTEEAYKLVLQP